MSSSAAPFDPVEGTSPFASGAIGGGALPDWAPYATGVAAAVISVVVLLVTGAFAIGLLFVATGVVSTVGIYAWSRPVEGAREAKNHAITFVIVFAFLLALTPLASLLYEVVHRGLARFDVAMTAFLKGETPSDVPQGLGMFFVPVNRAFLASVYTLDPTAVMRAVRQPTLILQGAHDAQITVRDAELLHAAKPDARLVVLPQANHLLKEAPNATLAAQGATYSDPTLPVMPDAVIALADWIAGLR